MVEVVIASVVCLVLGILIGMAIAFILTARDKTIVRLTPEQTIVVKEELLKLIKKARTSRGRSSDEEEEEAEEASRE